MFRLVRVLVAGVAWACVAGAAVAGPACPNAGFTVAELTPTPATHEIHGGPRGRLDVRREQITTTADIAEIKLGGDAYDTQVLLRLKPEAARRLHDATTNRAGMRVAFVVDDLALGLVTWQGPYGMDADLGLQLSAGRPAPEFQPLIEAVQRCIGQEPAR